jgi:DNA invertase Pin-like site-specific DNA recombinase
MTSLMSPRGLTDAHLKLKALVYIRQSDPRQVRDNEGSQLAQRGLAKLAANHGFRAEQIEVIAEDLGRTAMSKGHRTGYLRVVEMVENGEVGAIYLLQEDRFGRDEILGGHPKPANDGHLKTGQ